jgi:hypothetical protein
MEGKIAKQPLLVSHQGGLKEYKNRKPLRNLLVTSIFVYILSFFFTWYGAWYKIWWDSLFSLIVCGLGYYAIYDAKTTPAGKAFNLVRRNIYCPA